MERRGRAWLLGGLTGLALVGAAYASFGALMTRVGETVEAAWAGDVRSGR